MINEAGLDLIKSFEQCRLKAYKPTPDDVWTCGWGSTKGVTEDTEWTQEEADARLLEDLQDSENCVCLATAGTVISDNQYAALVSLVFNIGCGNFKTSTVLRRFLDGDDSGAADAFGMWVKQKDRKTGGMKTLPGLVRRRAAEEALFRS